MSASKSTREQILSLMQELGIEPKKSLGQNFLVSDHVVGKILHAAKRLNPASLIEIGPGLGALTRGLLAMGLPIHLIELDQVFAGYWRSKGIRLSEEDALHWAWDQISLVKPVVLVSNLPYQISSSLVIDRSLDKDQLSAMILMFQKEVAQRLKALPQTESYGMLSAMAQTFWDLEFLLEASSGDFMPPPKVASRVLIFKKKESAIADRKQYLNYLKACFLHPRKIMLSNLIEGLGKKREELIIHFNSLGVDEKTRAQQLGPKQFLDLYAVLGYK